jgi:carboxyl-terminal processing protease
MLGVGFGFLLAGVFAAGFFGREILERSHIVSATFPLLDEVQIILDHAYLREQPSYTQRQYGAIRGLLAALGDRNTFFIEPPVAQSEADVLAGVYGGIGVLTRRNEAGLVELYPIADSPADKAGIVDGAVLIEVNGTPISGDQSLDTIDQLLRGEVKDGNGVTITTQAPGAPQPETVFIAFDVIAVPSIVWRLLPENKQLGYIQLLRFTSRTPDELRSAVNELVQAGAKAFVVDLRNNGGGLLQEAVEVASVFVGQQTVAVERAADSERQYSGSGASTVTDQPVAIIVNNNTASAAEIVAGAIQDYGRGIVIGQKTFGKGTVQQIYGLSDGSSIHVTSAEWLMPSGKSIEGQGVVPDIEMIPDINGRDVELAEAVRQLTSSLESAIP